MTGSARYMQVCCNISGTFVHLVVPWMSVDISVYLGTTRLQFSYKTSITLRSQTRHQQEDHRFPGRWTSSYMNLLMAITWYQHACVSGKSHITWNVHSNIFSCFTEFAFVALNQQYSSFMHCFSMLTIVLCCQKHAGRQKHDDVIKWKIFPHYWPFVRGIHRSSVNSPHKGQWRGALMFSLICARLNSWVHNRYGGDLKRYQIHYDVIVMHNRLEPGNHQCDRCLGSHWRSYLLFPRPHDDVIKWKHFTRYWPFVRKIHRSPVNFPHKGQLRGPLMFSLICAWTNRWANNWDAGDLRRHRAHFDVTVISESSLILEAHYSRLSIYVNGQNYRDQGRSQCRCKDILIATIKQVSDFL